jgi:hypothetical protein
MWFPQKIWLLDFGVILLDAGGLRNGADIDTSRGTPVVFRLEMGIVLHETVLAVFVSFEYEYRPRLFTGTNTLDSGAISTLSIPAISEKCCFFLSPKRDSPPHIRNGSSIWGKLGTRKVVWSWTH